ncbi:Cro/Cl family transcriptional regulator [Campylobacter pinnipediorum subsp. pinnipediorum]|uniref:Crp/Fnr family transcriptional regulator n=1 Tax=Campylobacter pinnipediorum TaxID=1965231 RepID=UPI000994A202|nr:Crp/Fnr family transcriptional regulator [Campylobacter pinnipediorum]OPA74903.1 Cro/Cl family transcriptional regulator [Campylobacter pinnipediorum subsp. pinnipediorum]
MKKTRTRIGLAELEINNLLKKEEYKTLFKHRLLKKDSILYTDNISIVIIKNGSAKLSFFEDGDEFIIYHVLKNNITILDDSCALEFLEDSEIYSIELEDEKDIFQSFEFNKITNEALIDIILLQRKIIKSILYESAKGRIANFLIELAKEQDLKQNSYYYVFLPFSVKVLSSFVGLKRQSASTAFNELIKDDIIRKLTAHEFLIIDFNALQSYTNYNCLD